MKISKMEATIAKPTIPDISKGTGKLNFTESLRGGWHY